MKQVGPKAPKPFVNPMEALAIPPDEMIRLPPPPDRSYQIFWPIRKYSLIACCMTHLLSKLFLTLLLFFHSFAY